MRFSTLTKICDVLDCEPGDLLTVEPDIHQRPQEWEPAV